jgi:Rieske Fe-S protein
MADAAAPKRVTRRTFLGWWLAALLTATVITGVAPILVFLWPAPPKGQKKQPILVSLDTPLDQLQDGTATKFLAPSNPNSAFVMADGGGDNSPGDLAFGAFVVKTGSNVQVFAQNCSHLGCSISFVPASATHPETSFDCPCHGSRFHLDGSVLHGPAAYPLSHLTWKQGDSPNQIQVDGIVLGF